MFSAGGNAVMMLQMIKSYCGRWRHDTLI